MVDELYDRHYREARNELNSALVAFASRLGNSIGEAFAVLNRIEYSAPWATKPRRIRTH